MKTFYRSTKPAYTETLKGDKLNPEYWQYKTIYYHGFILFKKGFKNKLFARTKFCLHILGFRFTIDYNNNNQHYTNFKPVF